MQSPMTLTHDIHLMVQSKAPSRHHLTSLPLVNHCGDVAMDGARQRALARKTVMCVHN